MLEPEIRRLRRCGDGLLRRNLGDEHGYPAEIEVKARPAVRLHRADDLGTEHHLVPAGGRFRIGAAQMDVVVGEGGHASLPFSIMRQHSRARTGVGTSRVGIQAPRTVGRRLSRQAAWLSLASSVSDNAMNR